MIVQYDKFDRLETPALTLCNPGSKAVFNDEGQSLLSSSIGRIPYVQDLSVTFNFNAPSELTFSTSRPAGNGRPPYDISKQLAPKRYIYASGFGFFQIQSVTRAREDNVWTYTVQATSCEVELQQTPLPFITDGVMRLFVPEKDATESASSAYEGVLNLLLPGLKNWEIGTIDSQLLYESGNKQQPVIRNLEIGEDMSIYDYLTDTIQNAFNCLVLFDPDRRLIHFRDPALYRETNRTDIHLGAECLENTISVEATADNLYTAVYVTGGDDWGIRAVNPTGENVIYNFEPYYSWMSPELCVAVHRWRKKFNTLMEDQETIQKAYNEEMVAYYKAQHEKEKWTIVKDIYDRLYEQLETLVGMNIDDDGVTLNAMIKAANDKLQQQGEGPLDGISINEYINTVTAKIENCKKNIVKNNRPLPPNTLIDRQKSVSLSTEAEDEAGTIFTRDLLDELSHFIYVGEYQDEYIALTDEMEYEERLPQYRAMMQRAKQYLDTACKPSVKFDVDVASFLFSKHFERYATQLLTGCSISVETDDRVFETLYLTAFDVNYADKSLHLTFGNAYEKFDMQSVFNNVFPKKMFSAT